MVSIDKSALVQGEVADATDVLTPINDLESAINDLIDGTEAFTAINVDGGAIDGVTIGGNAAAPAITCTAFSAGTADINAGTIDNNVIGGTTPAAGSFTTLAATDGSGISALNGSNITSGTVSSARVGNLPASKITTGTFDLARIPDITLAKVTDAGTIASQDADSVNIDGGAIDGTVIGANSAAAATVTSATVTSSVIMETTAAFNFEDTTGTTRAGFVLQESGTDRMQLNMFNSSGTYINTAFEFDATTAAVAFFGNIGFNKAGVTKPTVTGSRGGNAALASLLTALANLGLITDSTTA
jgi:hypothetical protein